MDNNSGIYETFFNPDSNNNYLNSVNLSCEYYTEQQFNFLSCLSPSHSDPTSFSTIHVNARSFRENFDHFKTFLSTLSHSFSALAFTETWLHNDTSHLYNLSHYNAIHSCREMKRGGGVSLYVSDSFNYILRKDLSNDFNLTLVESLFIEIPSCCLFKGKSIVIGCIYRPPASDINTFIDALDSTLDIISKEHKLCLLHGDFNLNILHADHTATHDFLNTLYSVNFYPLITKPTRVTTHSASLIDNILLNSCVIRAVMV